MPTSGQIDDRAPPRRELAAFTRARAAADEADDGAEIQSIPNKFRRKPIAKNAATTMTKPSPAPRIFF
jgi:hypothetical protein